MQADTREMNVNEEKKPKKNLTGSRTGRVCFGWYERECG
jgi:hypothetical protein